ncbi:hypothetical protein GJ654_12505 [Rhodoblastus acidophilus]|uniref:Sacsin/Nov domain-containing protein n=1 Tax=Rhodoblastus acidophilus TaxID=1074 RepID=A0A6N8DN14_RHOAC|nr:hypothetical protein [Rhodoblastus acidophilus]MCW2275300.1 hypothetical protein [Rhodoblastus acidophilus]MTV31807.1 hypothetical protein [Rhodoblastus acidophilus]
MAPITTKPKDIYIQIQANLRDRYRSGFPVLKELIQNAEDAEAEVIRFVAHPGWTNARNPLLRVPGFVVVNDGRFEAKDARGILSFADTAKGDEVAAIGRFGFGQKAVFHLCDAFIAHSIGHAVCFSEVVNPCLGVIESTKAELWDEIDSDDLSLLETTTGDITSGFVLWLPLRCEAVLPAPKLCFTNYRPTGAALLDNLTQCEADLRLILSSMRHINRIEAFEGSTLRLALRRSQDSQRLLGPPREDREPLFHGSRAMVGMIENHAARSTRYAGREAYDVGERLKRLKQADDWPQVPVFTSEGELMQPEKAAEHGAVIVVENSDAGTRGVSIDWGVFLPIAEATRLAVDVSPLRIMLHGYFFVDSGRRYIEGFASDRPALGAGTTRIVYQQWNETLRDDLVLPLLPGVLHDALQQQMLTSVQLAEVTTALRRSLFGREHREAIAACNVLARRVRPSAAAIWELLSSESQIRSLPAPDTRGQVGIVELMPELCGWAERNGLTLIADQEAALTKADVAWGPSEIADLLAGLVPEVFLQGGRTAVLAAFIDVAVGGDSTLQVAAAKPLLAALRRALAATRTLAPGESIGAVLARLPTDAAIALPPSAGERAVLGALASAASAPLCLRREWLADVAARQSLSPAEAAPLIRALQSLLSDERTADSAGAAAVALAKLLGHRLDEAARDPAYAKLPVLRAADGSGVSRLVTLPDLVHASRDGRLFRDNPRVREIVGLMAKATPKLGVVIVTGATAELLADIGGPFAFAEAKNEAFARLISSAQEFGPAEARAKLLDRIYTDSSDARPALRVLAAGDGRAGGAQARLFTLPQTGGLLDDLALRLIEGSASDFLVPTVVAQELKPAIQSHLGVSDMDGDELGHLLATHAAALASMNLQDAEIRALLISDIPDEDLRTLPIFVATDGHRYQAAAVRRETANWKVPPALVDLVPILKLPPSGRKAVERAEKLVDIWSPAAQIHAALDQPEPHRHWAEIFQALDGGQEILDTRLRDRLNKRRWLPDRHERAWAPEDIFDLTDEILGAARQLLAQGDDPPFLALSELAPKLRENAVFETLRSYGFLSAGSASIEMLLLQVKEVSPVAFMSSAADLPAEALVALARQGSDLGLPGWPLLSALLRLGANGVESPALAPAKILDAFGSVTPGDVKQAVQHMDALSGLAEAGAEAARNVFILAFRALCSWPSTALQRVMSGVRVPTSDGNWRSAQEVAARVSGIASSHRLARELEEFWSVDASDDRVCDVASDRGMGSGSDRAVQRRTLAQMERECANSLKAVLSRAQSDVPPELLALLVGIIQQSKGFRLLVSKGLALPEAVTDRIWRRVQDEIESAFTPQRPGQSLYNIRQKSLFKFELVQPRNVEACSLAGERVHLPVGALEPLLIVGDGHRPRRTIELDGQDYWLRTVTVADATQPVGAEQIRRMIGTLALECLGYQPKCIGLLDELAGECTRVEQTKVDDARARLEDRFPQILDELKPTRGTALRRALDEYKRSEGSIPPGNERTKRLPELKQKLWTAVQSPESASQLLYAIRGKIEQFGYNPDRVLFELFQNADDAALQHPPPGEARFRLEASGGSLRVLHWGRPVNHPGGDAELGQREGWHHDLFNMLLMNLSDKREGVTGRFGLGFKSVHLLSADVGIASDFVACRVRGGMLPDVWDVGRQVSLDFIQAGRRATVIDIPVEPECEEYARKAVTAFLQAARWLPAMSRYLRKIELAGAESRIWTADFVATETPGISVVVLGGAEPRRGLALDLGDETTLFVPLSADGPTLAEADLPKLWLLAPLAESLASGWLMNGRRFRVDPGRGSLARGANEPQATFEQIGAALGARLCELYDLLERDWAAFAGSAGLAETSSEMGPATFWRRLAELFAMDFDDPIARHLHGPERGFGRLVRDCPVLPTGLPKPFQPFLRARDARHVAIGALDNPALLADLHDWLAIDDMAESTVSLDAASRLSALGFAAPSALTLATLVTRELRDDSRITPERAAQMGRVLNRERVNELPWGEQQAVLDAISKGRFHVADGSWREAQLPPRASADASDEEKLILTFAPDGSMANPGYEGPALALYRLARERSGFQQTAATFAAWASSMSEPEKQRALLNYVQNGVQGPALGAALAKMRLYWLPERSDDLRSSPLVASIAPDDLHILLGRLYPEEQRQRWSVGFEHDTDQEEVRSLDGRIDPTTFFERLYDWWEGAASKERAKSDRDAYPEGFHPGRLPEQSGDDGRVGWFTFFALGIFRTIGRSDDRQHRNFIAAAARDGWWGEMASAQLPDSPKTWVQRLEDFARADAWRIDFPQWRRALVDLYVVARWLPEYVDAVLTLPAIVRQQGPIALSDAWRLSASPLWQRRGLEGAPLTQSLGLGANWLVREAARLGIWTGEDAAAMHPYGWASTARVRALFADNLGIDLGPEANMDLSPDIYAQVEANIGDRASFLGDLDLPLQIIAQGRREDLLQALLDGPMPFEFDTNTNTDDEED